MAVVSRKTLLLFLLKRRISKGNKHKKSVWVRKLFKQRKTKGEFYLLVQDLRLFDEEFFFKYFRMTPVQYEEVLTMVGPEIQKSWVTRECIGPSERLCVTLRYLTTGDSQATIAMNFRMSPTTVGRIIFSTCEALWKVLSPYMKCPNNDAEWKRIALEFEMKWNFPHCIGALDGKHVVIQAPANSGSKFFNYKKTHSIVLMAVCNANYQFTAVDIGDSGRNSDGGVFSYSAMGDSIKKNSLGIPRPEAFPCSQKCYPYVIVADEAFQLQQNIMKPYPRESLGISERVFNYRLSRARVIENVFGIVAARFRVFRRPIHARVEMVIRITKAIVTLHNYLMAGRSFSHSTKYCPAGFVDNDTENGTQLGEWRDLTQADQGLRAITNAGSNNYSRDAKLVREDFKNYFMSPKGQVPWQWNAVYATVNCFQNND